MAATDWIINIEGGAGSACGDLNLDHIEDIRLYIDHEYFTLQTGLASEAGEESPPIREYQPIRRILPSQYLASPTAEAGSLSPAAPSADNDLNGLFVGTLVITQPLYLPPVELSVQLTDLAGSLTGYISPTLTFPVVPGSGHGPALHGSWSGSSFSLSVQPFVTDLIQGIPIHPHPPVPGWHHHQHGDHPHPFRGVRRDPAGPHPTAARDARRLPAGASIAPAAGWLRRQPALGVCGG